MCVVWLWFSIVICASVFGPTVYNPVKFVTVGMYVNASSLLLSSILSDMVTFCLLALGFQASYHIMKDV